MITVADRMSGALSFCSLQELAALGHQLLIDGGGGPSATAPDGLPAEVLIAAARQHLMATDALQLQLRHVALLLADYQELAASYYAHMMLSRWVKQPF
jgi:hypothetical protein